MRHVPSLIDTRVAKYWHWDSCFMSMMSMPDEQRLFFVLSWASRQKVMICYWLGVTDTCYPRVIMWKRFMVTPPTKDPRSLLVDQKVQVCQFDSVSRQPNWHTDATFRERPPTGSMLYLQHLSAYDSSYEAVSKCQGFTNTKSTKWDTWNINGYVVCLPRFLVGFTLKVAITWDKLCSRDGIHWIHDFETYLRAV